MSLTTRPESKSFSLVLQVSACALVFATSACATPGRSDDVRPVGTVRDVMADMVAPAADVLWSAIQTVSTPDGYIDKAPETDEEWAALKRSATTMAEAANLLLTEGRRIAPEGAASTAPGYNLEPDSIATLVAARHMEWVTASHELQDAARVFLDAIAARNADPLFDAGDGLNTACEDCHQTFWYPPS